MNPSDVAPLRRILGDRYARPGDPMHNPTRVNGFLLPALTRRRRLIDVLLRLLDLSLPTPAGNLACDEALLTEAKRPQID
jgi:hypothetical protein